MAQKDKSSLLLSIFKRKGGEGVNTAIIDNDNKSHFSSILEMVESSEQGLIIYHEDIANWFLVTNIRVIFSQNNSVQSIFYTDFEEVKPALKEELKKGVTAADEFTKLLIKDKNKKEYIVSIEKGNPYKGIYQLLHFAQD